MVAPEQRSHAFAAALGPPFIIRRLLRVLRDARWPKKPKPAKPRSIIAQVEGSGTGDAAGPKAISTVSVPTTGCGKVKVKARKVNAHGPTGDTRPGNGMPNTGRQLHPMGLCLEASPGIEPGCKDLQSSA
jgi:FAD/FMN-containing dehydrogenase